MSTQSESRFWDKYIVKTASYTIKPGVARWYVRHAECYIKTHSKRLATHSATDVDNYLKEKCRSRLLHDWQFQQIVMSIQILFVEMVKTPWAEQFPWDDWIERSSTLENSHPTVARDYLQTTLSSPQQESPTRQPDSKGTYKRVVEKYPHHIESLIRSFRVKHYSYRTEESYLQWLLRFYLVQFTGRPGDLYRAAYRGFSRLPGGAEEGVCQHPGTGLECTGLFLPQRAWEGAR